MVTVLALLLTGIMVPSSLPKAHADHQSISLNTTGYILRSTYDTYLGRTVDAVKAGSVLTFILSFTADNQNYQRNVSMGVKFDWMSNYQNISSTPVLANQIVYLTLNYTIPNLTGQYSGVYLVPHTWTLQVWDMAIGGIWNQNTFCWDTGKIACHQFTTSFYPLAVYGSAQANGMVLKGQAQALIAGMASILSATTPPAGSNGAIAQLAAANEQITLGNTAYQTGDFNTAQTDYQNALNSANAAQSSLATTGGGTDTATLTSIWITTVAVLLGGIGAVLAGFGGFTYLRNKSKSPSSNTPAPTPKP